MPFSKLKFLLKKCNGSVCACTEYSTYTFSGELKRGRVESNPAPLSGVAGSKNNLGPRGNPLIPRHRY